MKSKLTSSWLTFASLAVVSALLQGCGPSAHYRAHHDGESLYAVLYKQAHPGDTPQQIERLLGPGTPQAQQKMVSVCRKLAAQLPQSYPDGVQDDDAFLGYQLGPDAVITLQFRGGHLVNFVREQFAHYEPPAR